MGGSIVEYFIDSANHHLIEGEVIASVRSVEQLDTLRKLNASRSAFLKTIQLDLSDGPSVVAAVKEHNINIVIHTASSINPALAKTIITALSEHQTASGAQSNFIHTSGLSAFSPNTGWPEQVCNDTDDIFGTEKALADSFPLRATDVAVVEHAKDLGVKSYIVVPPLVYGRGKGPWNQLSVLLPTFISTALAQKKVYKFPENTTVAAVHISDILDIYNRILQTILRNVTSEDGEKAYYFALAHDLQWHDIAAKLAEAMKARGLVTDGNTGTWANSEDAAEAFDIPASFLQLLWNSGSNMVAHNKARLGWEPKWTEEEFYAHIDDEIQAVVELGNAKSSMIDSLRQAARG